MQEPNHARLAADFLANTERANWHDQTLWMVREKRDKAAEAVEDWEQWRQLASEVKLHTLSLLDEYLVQFEKQAVANGAVVHWARDAREHNEIIASIAKARGVKRIVKSKSMLTEECHLNPYLEECGIEITDTDLGEWIVQLRQEMPSHIVLPAIHLNRREVSQVFHEKIGTDAANTKPEYLARAARQTLREKFLQADMAITGVNFAIAENGAVVVCTNEGNADMGVHATPVHVACMGVEKLLPRVADLGLFLRLLARSATGQPITSYSSVFKSPEPGAELHIVILDNGRSRQLANPDFFSSLKCIRCGACFNTCPVYRRSGGHSYHTAVAGPIGAILSPNQDLRKNADLPFASTLCGSCSNVCPVKIDIHTQLWKWRQVIATEGLAGSGKTWGMKLMSAVLARPFLYKWTGRLARSMMKHFPFLVKNRLNPWYKNREMPQPPAESFGDWYAKQQKQRSL